MRLRVPRRAASDAAPSRAVPGPQANPAHAEAAAAAAMDCCRGGWWHVRQLGVHVLPDVLPPGPGPALDLVAPPPLPQPGRAGGEMRLDRAGGGGGATGGGPVALRHCRGSSVPVRPAARGVTGAAGTAARQKGALLIAS